MMLEVLPLEQYGELATMEQMQEQLLQLGFMIVMEVEHLMAEQSHFTE